MFASNNSKHFSGASSKTCEYYTPELEKQVEDMFASDYARYDFFGDTAHPQHGKTNGCTWPDKVLLFSPGTGSDRETSCTEPSPQKIKLVQRERERVY